MRFFSKFPLLHPEKDDKGRRIYVLDGPLVYRDTGRGLTVYVQDGFKTDLASVPRILTPLFPRDGDWLAAAVVHDWLYEFGRKMPGFDGTREDADLIFLQAMEASGVGWRRHVIHRAVRVGGGAYWYGRRERDAMRDG